MGWSTQLRFCITWAFIFGASSLAFGMSAPGAPGKMGTWPRPDKAGYGTTVQRPVWFAIADGVLAEVAFPRVDLVQTRDTFVVIHQGSKFYDEREFKSRVSRIPGTLAYRVYSEGFGIKIKKEISATSENDAIVMDYEIQFNAEALREIILVHNPMAAGTAGGDFMKVEPGHNTVSLLAHQGDVRGDEPAALHVGSKHLVSWSLATKMATVGFEGHSSPLDQMEKGQWPQVFSEAGMGNVAGSLVAEVHSQKINFRVLLQFFDSSVSMSKVFQGRREFFGKSMRWIVDDQRQGWLRYLKKLDYDHSDRHMESSILVLKALEDKVERGAYVAGAGNPSLPWAIYAPEQNYENSRRRIGDSNFGYRRVWPRDLFHKGMALLAVGDSLSAVQILRWFKKTQLNEGWWAQNMFVDGAPSWQAYQQDQAAFPVILVAHLVQRHLVEYVEFRKMVRKALGYLIQRGPSTDQERWEENGGISPNSLAVAVQALWGGYGLESRFGDVGLANRYRELAIQWTHGLKTWNLIRKGYYGNNYLARIEVGSYGHWDPSQHEAIEIKNKNQKQKAWFREDEILDLGFVQWIISGLMSWQDPDFQHSLEICDQYLSGTSALGKGYFRYTEDAYGVDHKGGMWPLLSGERLLTALEMRQDFRAHLDFIENLFTESGMLGEQNTLSVRPLGWSHANYLIVRKSIKDGRSFYRYLSDGISNQK